MIYVLVILHVVIAIALVISILLQSGRGGGLASTFGGGLGTGALFGGHAGDFLAKLTGGLGIAFVVLTLVINLVATSPQTSASSVIQNQAQQDIPAQGVPTGGGMPQTPPPSGAGEMPATPAGQGGALPETPPPTTSGQ